MATENMESTILHEHSSIVTLRHVLAIINFIAIFAGTLVTSYFVQIRGIAPNVLLCLRIMAIINVVQILICIADLVLKFFFGRYHKWLVITSYTIGGAWLIVAGLELLVSSLQLGGLRIDLAAITVIQLLTGLIAYIIWPSLDHFAIQKLTSPKVRDDSTKRAKCARRNVIRYVAICLLVAMLQGGALLSYKLPPKVYDLFSESRAVEYRLTSDGEGYEVVGLYSGTSDYVNIPAYYNNKPVLKILSGALDDTSLLNLHEIKKLEIGTLTTDENGNEFWDSKITAIEKDAIVNNNIESLVIPKSVVSIQDGSIKSTSIKNISYQAKADFSYSYLDCSALSSITFEGEDVGNILSLTGMKNDLIINVNKDIYNVYRERNPQYMASLRPILAEDEYVVDFYTNSDYYINSIFCKVGEEVKLGYLDLKNDSYVDKTAPYVDTLAYIDNRHETGTDGAKDHSAFRGWYTDKEFAQECVFTKDGKVSFNTSTSIYAKWIDEYKATLDWSTFMPENQPTEMYWTNEDLITFPVIIDRAGYSDGVQWYIKDTTNQVLNSQGISQDISVTGVWILDTPVIDINPRAMASNDPTFNIATDKNAVGYTYDETQKVFMDAEMSHPLEGTSFNNVAFMYSTTWTKVGDSSYSKTESTVSLENVPESGEYTLTVVARSPYGETSTAQTNISVNITKKAIEMGTVELFSKTTEYSSTNQTVSYVGDLVEPRVKTTYNYYKDDELVSTNSGIKDAGTYTVKALFQKSDLIEAQNYETKELVVDLVITPHQLGFVGWIGGDYVYNSAEQRVSINLSGVFANDTVNVVYEGNAQTNAGQYVAKAVGVDNPNYSITDIDNANNCTFSWEIKPKEVSVKEWKLDGSVTTSFSIVYNGEEHVLQAVMEGVYSSDTQNVDFVYDSTANHVVAKDANKYTAKIINVNNANYTLVSEDTQEWEITKRPIDVQFYNTADLIYNSKTQGINAYLSGVVANDVALFNSDSFVYEGKSTEVNVGTPTASGNDLIIPFTSINAQTYTAAISEINSASAIALNYVLNISAPVTETFEIKPKNIYVYNNTPYEYNAESQKLYVQVYGVTAEDLSSLALDQFTTENVVEGYVDGEYYNLALYGKDAGEYALKVTGFNNSNYILNAFDGSITIQQKTLTTSWYITDNATNTQTKLSYYDNFDYNFAGYTVYAEISGVMGDETVNLDYQECTQTNAGTYYSTLSLPATYANYTLSSSTIAWRIIPYVVDFAWTFNGEAWEGSGTPTFEYNAQDIEVKPVFTVLGNDVVDVIYSYDDLVKKNASTLNYQVKVSELSNSNYTVGANDGINWKINPKTVKVTWSNTNDITYNAQYAGPSFAIEGLLETDRVIRTKVNSLTVDFDVTSIDSQTKYSYVSKNQIIDADTYTCKVTKIYTSSSTEDKNYTVQADECNFKINKAKVKLGSWSTVNNGSSLGTYTSTTKLIYNSYNYVLTTVIESGLLTRGGVQDDVTLSYQRNSCTSAGNYTSTAYLSGLHADNYTIEGSNTFNWTINKKPITVIWDNTSFTYNRSNQYVYAQVTKGATGDDDLKVYNGDSISLEYSGNYAYNAGTYTAKVTGVSNSNYYCVDSSTEKVWTIAPKTVDVSWYDTEMTYRGYNIYPYAYLSEADLGYEYTKETDSKNVGSYVISINSITNSNYIVSDSTKTKTYKIIPLIVNLEWWFDGNESAYNFDYDGTTRTIGAKVSNIKSGDIVNITYAQSELTLKNAKTYQFNATGVDNENYKLDLTNSYGVSKSITVYPRTLDFTWGYGTDTSGAQGFTYDGVERTISAHPTNLVSGDSITLTYNNDRKLLNQGSYSFKVTGISGEDAGNYALSSYGTSNMSLTVSQQLVSIDWTGDASLVYDGQSHEVSATVKGYNDGKDVAFTYTGVNSFKDSGSYSVSVKLNDNNYYVDSYYSSITYYITIEKATATVIWTGEKVIEYDGYKHLPSVTATGVDGEIISTTYSNQSYTDYTNVGSKTVYLQLINNNYKLPNDGTDIFQFEIVPKELFVTWFVDGVETTFETTSLDYDGNTHYLTAEVKDADGNNYTHVTNYYKRSITSAGKTTMQLSINNYSNYCFASESGFTSATLEIKQAMVDVSWSQSTFTYDGTTHYVHATIVGSNGKTLVEGTDFRYTGKNYLSSVGTLEVEIELRNSNYTLNGVVGNTTVTLTIELQPEE